MVPQAIARPFAVAGQLVTGRCRYMGFVVLGVTDNAFDVTLWTGPATTGRAIDIINFATPGAYRQWYGPQGILCEDGVTVGTLTGTLTGIIYYIPQDMLNGQVLIDQSGSQRVIVEMHNQVDIDAAFAALNQGP